MASNWSNATTAAAKPPRISWRELRSLPSRLCAPPPAVGNARSFGVTPIFEVQLEAVLANELLPPLSLRDFEQYLLFVGGHPEFLYFVLWLREYTTRYQQWSSVAKKTFRSSLKNSPGDSRRGHPEHSSSLASFFHKAQQTFFVKGAQYELDVPSDVLAPFATFDSVTARWKCQYGAHPDPDVFSELSQMAHQRLKIALNHCVLTNYTNVGNGRARCGIMAGTFFMLLGTVPPLALNFCRGLTRWERLASMPGLFLGLTILIASLHGVCIMIWIFGDFRQLRKFEYEAAVEKMPEPLSGYRFPALNEKTAHSSTDIQSPSRTIPQPLKLHALSRFQPSLAPIAACDEIVPPSPSGTQHSVPELSRRASSVSGFAPITPVRTYFPPTIPQLAQTRSVKIVTPDDHSFTSYSTIAFKHPISSEALLAGRRGSCPETIAQDSRCSGAFSGEDHDEDPASADPDGIEISEAFFDERPDPSSTCLDKPLAIPAASVMANELGQYMFPDGRKLSYSSQSQYQTATFIPISVSGSQYSHGYGDDIEAGNYNYSREPVHFDFDGLPLRNWNSDSRRGSRRSSYPQGSRPDNGVSYSSRRSSVISVPGISTRFDESGDATPHTASGDHRHVSASAASSGDLDTPNWLSVVDNVLLKVYRAPNVDASIPSLPSEEVPIVTTRLHEMLSVPTFASPLTRVLNPVVTRAQWEIVVRSAAVSMLATVITEVVLVALPVPH